VCARGRKATRHGGRERERDEGKETGMKEGREGMRDFCAPQTPQIIHTSFVISF